MKKLDGIREVFRNTKHQKPCQIFCPRCGSPKINLNSSLDIWLTPRQYHCENCGYTGIIVMELEPETVKPLETEQAEPSEKETQQKDSK